MRSGERVAETGRAALRAVGSEAPDTLLPASEREELKRVIENFAASHSEHALAFLSNGLWAAAEAKLERRAAR